MAPDFYDVACCPFCTRGRSTECTQSRQTNNFIYRTGESRKTFFLNPTIAVKFNL